MLSVSLWLVVNSYLIRQVYSVGIAHSIADEPSACIVAIVDFNHGKRLSIRVETGIQNSNSGILVTFIQQALGYTEALLAAGEPTPQRLLQVLWRIQHRCGSVPEQVILRLSASLGIPPARIRGVIGFYSFLHAAPRGDYDILFSDNITDRMAGGPALARWFCERMAVEPGVPRSDGRLTVDTTSCTGMGDQGPALLINGRAITRLDRQRLEQIADLIDQHLPLQQWPQPLFQVDGNIHRRDALLETVVAPGEALGVLLKQGAERQLQELEQSGLRGRGGAGFKTALKWRLCRAAPDAQRYVVCNADEGEPGTFKDRVLLQFHPDQVIEGMTLCAGVIGAGKGFIYLRGEYRYLLEPLQAALERRREQGLLGESILDRSGFDFDIEIHLGAGAYICGEESALIESLEGKRGIPRNRPPFPVTEGYLGHPTVVNNVETLMAAALIGARGSTEYRRSGTAQSSGTKLLSISGDCRSPGVYEYPMGVSIRQVLEDCGGIGAQAVQVSGAAGETIPEADFERCIAFEDVATGGSFMVFGRPRKMLEMVQNFNHFFTHESCGFCTPCRVGGVLLRGLVDKLCRGQASGYDLQEMRQIGSLMRDTSHCGLGQTAARPVLDMLERFPDWYRSNLSATGFEPDFDLDAALDEARELAGRLPGSRLPPGDRA